MRVPGLAWLQQRLTGSFFAHADGQSLNLFRLLYCLSIAFCILADSQLSFARLRLAHHPQTYLPIRLFELFGVGRLSAEAVTVLQAVLLLALVSAAVGFLTRWALTASWIGFFLYYGTIHSSMRPPFSDMIGHRTEAVVFVLLILSLSPGVGLWGIDGWLARGGRWRLRPGESPLIAAWPLQSVKLLLALIYFGAAFCKLGGIRWLDGSALQALLIEKAMQWDGGGPGLWLARHRFVCATLGTVAILFEASFSAVLFFPRVAWLYALAGVLMHALILATLNLNYFYYFACMYWIFLSWPFVLRVFSRLDVVRWEAQALAASLAKSGDHLAAGRARLLAGVFIGSLAVINLVCILRGFEAWPLSSWSFYGEDRDFRSVRIYRLQAELRNGAPRWLNRMEGNTQSNVALSNCIDYALAGGAIGWIEAELAAVVDELPLRTVRELSAVVVVKRTVRGSSEGPFEFVDTPLFKVRVDGGPPALYSDKR